MQDQDRRWSEAERQERIDEVLHLRTAGVGWYEIARLVTEKFKRPISHIQVWKDHRRALDERIKRRHARLDHQIEHELEALEGVIRNMWPVMVAGKQNATSAARTIIRALESRRRLLGLDAATRFEISGPGGAPVQVDVTQMSVDQLQARFQELRTILGQPRARKVIDVTPAGGGRVEDPAGPMLAPTEEEQMAAYEAKLRARKTNGSGTNGSGGNGHG